MKTLSRDQVFKTKVETLLVLNCKTAQLYPIFFDEPVYKTFRSKGKYLS